MEFSPLVVFVLLSTTAKCVFVSAAGASTCDSCTCSKDKKEDECDRIRLVDPTRDGSAGKIEVCIGNYWKAICLPTDSKPDYPFTEKDADVACFQLGFTRADKNVSFTRGSACRAGQNPNSDGQEVESKSSTAELLLVSSPCHGWEERLVDCGHLKSADDDPSCSIDTAVIVTCEKTLQVKLFLNSDSSYLGKVMHYFNYSWHTVCDSNWMMSESNVLCHQLGLGHAEVYWLQYSNKEDNSFLHMNMDCIGTENKLRMCPHKNFTVNGTCDGKSVPWVLCAGNPVREDDSKTPEILGGVFGGLFGGLLGGVLITLLIVLAVIRFRKWRHRRNQPPRLNPRQHHLQNLDDGPPPERECPGGDDPPAGGDGNEREPILPDQPVEQQQSAGLQYQSI